MTEAWDIALPILRAGAIAFVSLSWLFLGITLLHCLTFLIDLPAAWWELRKRGESADMETPQQLLLSDMAPSITVIVPAYNEEKSICESVRSLLSLDYPSYNVIVVNDGSSDATLQKLVKEFDLRPTARAYDPRLQHAPLRGLYASPRYPELLVIDKVNGMKADAVNAGLNLARAPLFCVLDADSILEGRALLQVVRPFIEDPIRMVAVGAPVRPVNGCQLALGRVTSVAPARRYWPLMQTIEYTRSFFLGRLARSRFGVLTIISGAFGVFHRETAVSAGGFAESLGEDMEMVLKLHHFCGDSGRPYAMRYVTDPVCWTQVPETRADLRRQRVRWQRGALECLALHGRMAFHRRYGAAGMFGIPLAFFSDVITPIAEFLSYITIPLMWAAGLLSLDFLLAFLALVFAFGIFISCTTLGFEETEAPLGHGTRNLLLLVAAAIVENFGYRQMNSYWRLVGTWKFLRGEKANWGRQTRRGYQQVTH